MVLRLLLRGAIVDRTKYWYVDKNRYDIYKGFVSTVGPLFTVVPRTKIVLCHTLINVVNYYYDGVPVYLTNVTECWLQVFTLQSRILLPVV